MSTKVKQGRARPRRLDASHDEPSTSAQPQGAARDPRGSAILEAAFRTFVEHGVSGATTEDIARHARVSKREIYRLFGSKEALFAELIRDRANAMREPLVLAPPAGRAEALAELERFGRDFLRLLTAPSTVVVYRLAVAEAATLPELGRQLDAVGRGTVASALVAWFAEACRRRVLPVSDPDRAAGSFMALLIGDLTVRLLLGAVPTPPEGELDARAARARAAFERLWLA